MGGKLRELFVTYPHISGLGTHHGGCGGRGEDGGRGQTGREGREGVLVGVLVLVHVLVLVILGPQERHGGQRRGGRPPAPLRTLNQEAVVQLLPQEVMLCKKGERGKPNKKPKRKKEKKKGGWGEGRGGYRKKKKKGTSAQSVFTTRIEEKKENSHLAFSVSPAHAVRVFYVGTHWWW